MIRDRVQFLVGGVQKGGTTALFDYLNDVPGLNLAPEKEVHFFDNESVDWSRPDYGAYHARFDKASEGALSGEVTPIYIYWPNCLERIHGYNPAMRIILLFRDPVARAWSHWRMEQGYGTETEPFGWCIREGRARLQTGDRPGFHRVHSYVERGFYGEQLQNLFRWFAPEQILLLRSANLSQDPQTALRRISDFLGVTCPEVIRPRRVHVTPAADQAVRIDSADVRYLRDIFSRDQALFSGLSGLALEPELLW